MKSTHLLSKKNKFFVSLILLTFVFASCKKDEVQICETGTSEPSEVILPDSFTKKVLIEKFTGEWCVNCPSGTTYLNDIIASNPEGTVIGTSVHQGDFLEIPFFSTLSSFLDISGYPRGTVNRSPAQNTQFDQDGLVVYSRQNWGVNTTRELAKIATCGLKIETSIVGNTAEIKVHCAANTELEETKLSVYLIEDGIPESSPGAQAGGNSNYIHNKVLRNSVTSGTGEDVDLNSSNSAIKTFSNIDISGYNQNNLKVVAFIHYQNTSTEDFEVLNVQQVKMGETKEWD